MLFGRESPNVALAEGAGNQSIGFMSEDVHERRCAVLRVVPLRNRDRSDRGKPRRRDGDVQVCRRCLWPTLAIASVAVCPHVSQACDAATRATPPRARNVRPREIRRGELGDIAHVVALRAKILDAHFGRRLDFDTDLPVYVVRRFWIVIDHHRHQLSIDHMPERPAAGDDGALGPFIRSHQFAKLDPIADDANQPCAPLS